jgi:hypothetical protein
MESYIKELTAAAKILAQHDQDASPSTPHHRMTAQGSCFDELRQARRSILSIAARIYTSFAEPTDFLQHLASQVSEHSILFSLPSQLHSNLD